MSEGRARLGVLGGDLRLKQIGLPVDCMGTAATLNGKSVAATGRATGVGFAGLELGPGDWLDLKVPGLSLLGLPELATL